MTARVKPTRPAPRKRPAKRPPRKPGQPTVWTATVVAALKEALNVGCTVRLACEYAGIAERTYYEHQAEVPQFAQDMSRARSRGAVRDLALIEQQATKDWRAAAWKLEHVFADDFAATQRHEVTGKGGGPVKVVAEVEPEFVADVLSILGGRGDSSPAEGGG